MSKKNGFPMPMSGGGGAKKAVGSIVLIVILVMIVKNPTGSAALAHDLVAQGSVLIDSLSAFFTHL